MFTRRTLIATALLSMAGLSTVTLTGCSDPETPTEVAVAFVKAMYEGDRECREFRVQDDYYRWAI